MSFRGWKRRGRTIGLRLIAAVDNLIQGSGDNILLGDGVSLILLV